MTDNPEMYNHTANTDEEYTPYYLRPETYIVPILFSIIFVVGVVGNGTLIVIFLRHKSMRNIPNTYIFSLALADLLVILTCVPFTSIIYTLESWPWGEFICKVSETCKDVSVGVSVFTLTALSAERYCAVVNPLKRLQTKPLTVISAAMIWVLAVLFAIPDAISSRVYKAKLDVNTTIEYCSPFPNITNGEIYMKTSIVMKCLVYYMIPLSIISCFYILMAIRLNRSAKDMPGEKSGTQGLAQSKARKHIAKMVLIFIFRDSGYPLRPWLLTPLEREPEPNTPEATYNIIHRKIRCIIERCNGLLKMRFRCLLRHRVLHYTPEFASQITNACAILHNICVENNVEEPVREEEDIDVDFGLFVNVEAHGEAEMQCRRVNPQLAEARKIQKRLIQNYFSNVKDFINHPFK